MDKRDVRAVEWCSIGRLVDWSIGRLVDWSIGRSVGLVARLDLVWTGLDWTGLVWSFGSSLCRPQPPTPDVAGRGSGLGSRSKLVKWVGLRLNMAEGRVYLVHHPLGWGWRADVVFIIPAAEPYTLPSCSVCTHICEDSCKSEADYLVASGKWLLVSRGKKAGLLAWPRLGPIKGLSPGLARHVAPFFLVSFWAAVGQLNIS